MEPLPRRVGSSCVQVQTRHLPRVVRMPPTLGPGTHATSRPFNHTRRRQPWPWQDSSPLHAIEYGKWFVVSRDPFCESWYILRSCLPSLPPSCLSTHNVDNRRVVCVLPSDTQRGQSTCGFRLWVNVWACVSTSSYTRTTGEGRLLPCIP